MVWDAGNIGDWNAIAEDIISRLHKRSVLCLTGNLGAGKTSFTTALVEVLGGATDAVQSPTFSIIHEYKLNNARLFNKIYHLDLYRLNEVEELLAIGLYDLLDSNELVIIEWPEKALPLLDRSEYLDIKIEHLKSGRRLILEN